MLLLESLQRLRAERQADFKISGATGVPPVLKHQPAFQFSLAVRQWHTHRNVILKFALVAAAALLANVPVRAQESAEPAAAEKAKLDEIESRLAERFDRLEVLAGRQAELSASTQPRRAELLRQLISRGRERNVSGQFDDIIAALKAESFSTAVEGQTTLQTDLEKLLELLLQEDRDRQLETERKRVLRYLQDLNKLIRMQRGVNSRTEGGDDQKELSGDQKRVADDTDKLNKEIDENNASAEKSKAGEPSAGSPQDGQPPKPEGEESDENPSNDEKSKEQKSGDQQSGEQQSGEQQSSEQQSGEQQSGEQQSGEQQSGEQKSGQQQQGGQPAGGDSPPSENGASSDQQQQQSPMQRAAESLRRARERMQEAQKRLDEAKRAGAVEEQKRAVEELEQAKANLEKILRQLREEELERMLVLLEARFRKMLDDQVAVYEETKKLDTAAKKAPAHEIEIASGRLCRRERLIVRDADRALVLLREDGTSEAFPEAVEQARDDMQQIAERLNRVRVDMITQGMEEDVIAALEETLATLQQALEKLRDQRAQQQGGGGEPGEQPLVDQLAELRMIRALQLRVNRRTTQYGAMIEGEQALESDLLGLLDELALRQAKIVQATHDLETGSNK